MNYHPDNSNLNIDVNLNFFKKFKKNNFSVWSQTEKNSIFEDFIVQDFRCLENLDRAGILVNNTH